MMTLTTDGVEDLFQGLQGMQRQIPYAAANGVNATARRVKVGVRGVMGFVFDRPTPFVLNSLQMTPAMAPRTTAASVWFKDPPNLGTKGHFLLPQVEGGSRPMKPWEMGMGGKFIVPSKFATLDQYGNLGRGQITKLLSISGGFRESGFVMNSRDKGRQKMYFRLLKQTGKLPPGIYERYVGAESGGRAGRFLIAKALLKKEKIKGGVRELRQRTKELYPRGMRSMVLFPGKAPAYTKRLDFYGIAEQIVNAYLPQDLATAIDAEIARELAYRSRR